MSCPIARPIASTMVWRELSAPRMIWSVGVRRGIGKSLANLWMSVKVARDGIYGVGDPDENRDVKLIWYLELGASYQILCDTAEEDSTSRTLEPTPSITQFLASDQPTSSPTADAESTSLTFVPIASHTPDPNDLNSSSLNSRNTIPTPTIIGMAVGFAVAGLLVVGLILLWLRERKKRKSLEWSTEPKRESKLSVGSKRASKRSTKGHGPMQVTENTIWRPSGIAGSPPP